MHSKQLILFFALIICTLHTSAQSTLTFTSDEWDFGAIREANGIVSHTFTGINTSTKPIVILEITSSCGCTTPEFSRKPILPGAKTEIKVSFDPANRPGVFIKTLGVFDSQRRKVAVLTIRGDVSAREKSIEERYPVAAANGLRLTQSLCTFSFLYHGRPASSAIGIVNTSSQPLRLELQAEDPSGFLSLDYPSLLAAGARGEIHLQYLLPEQASYYGTVKDVAAVYVDGQQTTLKLAAHGIAVDNPMLSNEIHTPKAEIDKYILKFGVLKRAGGVRKHPVVISNRGDGVLAIRAVEHDSHIATTLRAGQTIEAEEAIAAYITINPEGLDYGPLSEYLTIITNDPQRPMRRVRITAIIED